MSQSLPFELTDAGSGRRTVRGQVAVTHGQLWLHLDGYGEQAAAHGSGTPLGLELYEGRLRLLAWPDINSEEVQVIDLEGAAEHRRGEQVSTEAGN